MRRIGLTAGVRGPGALSRRIRLTADGSRWGVCIETHRANSRPPLVGVCVHKEHRVTAEPRPMGWFPGPVDDGGGSPGTKENTNE